MWPKVFAQLVDLLPHITRLIPMADIFFQTRTAGEKAHEAALSTLARDVRTDLEHVTSTHEGLHRQLQALSAQVAGMADDLKRSAATVESLAIHIAAQDRQIAALKTWILVAVLLIALVLGGLVILLLRFH